MSLPDPTGQGQGPVEWGAMDYAAWGAKTAVWGTGKAVQYMILKPLELLGNGATELENYLFVGEASDSPTLEDRDITHTPENKIILPEKAIKTMQGEKFEQNTQVEDLEHEIRQLKRQLEELQANQNLASGGKINDKQTSSPDAKEGTEQSGSAKGPRLAEENTSSDENSGSDSAVSKKPIRPPAIGAKEGMEKPTLAEKFMRQAGGIQFKKVENDADDETITGLAPDIKPAQDGKDLVVEEYTSPLYDGKDEAYILQKLQKTLDELSSNGELKSKVTLDELLAKPPPPPKVIAGATRGRGGGPAVRGQRDDTNLLRRLEISPETLKARCEAFAIVHNELDNYISSTNSQIAKIKKGVNEDTINKAIDFENTRPEEINKLPPVQEELMMAKVKYESFSQLIEKYQELKKSDPKAASRMQVKFSKQSGTMGKKEKEKIDTEVEIDAKEKKDVKEEIRMESMEQVVEKRLIEGYENEVMRIERNLKTQIASINSSKNSNVTKYAQNLRYKNSPQDTEYVKITLGEVMNLQKNIDVAMEKIKVLEKNMDVYKVNYSVTKELTPEQKEMREKIKMKMANTENTGDAQTKTMDLLGALIPSNVADYSFELLDKEKGSINS